MKYRISKVHLWAIILFVSVAVGCYPLATGSLKWRITRDHKTMRANKHFLTENMDTTQTGQPNIIFIIADDLGKYDISTYNGTVNTPHMDSIAAAGARFDDAYVSSPVCAPSRAGMLTGRYQTRFGFESQMMEFYPTNMVEYLAGKFFTNTGDWVLRSKPVYPREWQVAKQGLPPSELTMGELFQAFGYSTAFIGKWHLGEYYKMVPEKRGFEETYGFRGAFSLYTADHSSAGYVNHVDSSFSSMYEWKSGRYGGGAIRENGNKIKEEEYLTFAIKDRAIDQMEKHVANGDPFMMCVSFSAPHEPFQAPVDYYCKFADEEDHNKRVYYAMISALDDAIGEIDQKVKDLGIEENTIIVVISDNGGATYTHATDNGPLKGGKLTQFEGGLNVPFFMKWKGQIPAGTVVEEPVISLDIFATLVQAGNVKLPTDRVYDGVDLLPFINGATSEKPHESLFWRSHHVKAMRKGDWKFILSERDKWIHLYDLKNDRSERYDLKDEKPAILEEMLKEFEIWDAEQRRPLWPNMMDRKFELDSTIYLFPA